MVTAPSQQMEVRTMNKGIAFAIVIGLTIPLAMGLRAAESDKSTGTSNSPDTPGKRVTGQVTHIEQYIHEQPS